MTDSWVQTDNVKQVSSNTALKTGCNTPPEFKQKQEETTPRSNNLATQLQGIGSLLQNKLPPKSYKDAVCGTDPKIASTPSDGGHLSVEEALYSLQDNLLPGDNLSLGEYQLVTLPVSGPGKQSQEFLVETINKMFG